MRPFESRPNTIRITMRVEGREWVVACDVEAVGKPFSVCLKELHEDAQGLLKDLKEIS